MQMCKLTTTVSNQAHWEWHWFNIWNMYMASTGSLSRALHLTLSMPKKYGKSWGCTLNMPDNVWSHDEKGVLEMMWELDECLLCQSLVYVKSLQLAKLQSIWWNYQTEENKSMFNRNTQNTFADAAARSSCFQSEQVLQHDWQINSLSPRPHKDSCWESWCILSCLLATLTIVGRWKHWHVSPGC